MISIGVKHTAPVLISLLPVVVLLGLIGGKFEKWRVMDTLYFAFIEMEDVVVVTKDDKDKVKLHQATTKRRTKS